jgi:hypothetical protein
MERRTTLPLFVRPAVHRSSLLFTRSARHPQRMVVLQLLRKQRASLSSFCLRNCSRRPMGDAALPTGKRLQNSLPEFRRCADCVLDLTIGHENLALSNHSPSYRNRRLSAARRKRGCSGSCTHHSRFTGKQSLSALSAVGRAWRTRGAVSVRSDSVWSPVF